MPFKGAPVVRRPDTSNTVYFWEYELRCKETGGMAFAAGFLQVLAELRMLWDRPMVVSSCCRSARHNTAVGGHPRSLHVYDRPAHRVDGTAAIDILFYYDVAAAWQFERLLSEQGWSFGKRPGMYHLDRRELAGLPPGSFLYD